MTASTLSTGCGLRNRNHNLPPGLHAPTVPALSTLSKALCSTRTAHAKARVTTGAWQRGVKGHGRLSVICFEAGRPSCAISWLQKLRTRAIKLFSATSAGSSVDLQRFQSAPSWKHGTVRCYAARQYLMECRFPQLSRCATPTY